MVGLGLNSLHRCTCIASFVTKGAYMLGLQQYSGILMMPFAHPWLHPWLFEPNMQGSYSSSTRIAHSSGDAVNGEQSTPQELAFAVARSHYSSCGFVLGSSQPLEQGHL